jgi:Trp operon repressor
MFIAPIYLIIGGLIVLYLIFKVFEYRAKIGKPEVSYVDTSGIPVNPPTYIEVIKNKTINFKLNNKCDVKICHLSLTNGLNTIQKICILFDNLNVLMQKQCTTRLEEIQNNFLKSAAYKNIINQVFILSKPFVKSKRSYRKALYKKALKDFEWFLLVVESIYNYWIYLGKLQALISRGKTLRLINPVRIVYELIEEMNRQRKLENKKKKYGKR